MRRLHFISVWVIIVALAPTHAWPQNENEGIMVLKSREFVTHEEPLVRFDHYFHENFIQCLVCHHDFKVFSNRNEKIGTKCSSCHKREPNEDIPVPLLEAFHGNCIDCHQKHLDRGQSSGPVDCGDCHLEE